MDGRREAPTGSEGSQLTLAQHYVLRGAEEGGKSELLCLVLSISLSGLVVPDLGQVPLPL